MSGMLLKQMLEAPKTSSNLVVYDPFQPLERHSLLKEVVGLANARVDGPRNILFGVNPGAIEGNAVVGIPEEAIRELKRAHRLASTLVEPALDLAFIFDNINGKLVGALEIDGCDFGPYFLAQDLSDELQRGACWIREDRNLVEIDRRALLNGHEVSTEPAAPTLSPEDISVSIGFNDDPNCDFLELEVPDTSDPPFDEDGKDGGNTTRTMKFKQALKDTVSTMTTQMLGLKKSRGSSDEESGDAEDFEKQIAKQARENYFYEERAAKVDVSIRNNGDVDVENLSVELGCPSLKGFDIADRVYSSPFDKRTDAELKKLGYPEVKNRKGAIIVRTTVDALGANETRALFRTPLRLAVGPKALGRKVAMQYVLRDASGNTIGEGRLKLRLGGKPNGGASGAATHYQSLDDE